MQHKQYLISSIICWIVSAIVLFFLLSGCASWSTQDKILLGASWGAAFADYKTTSDVLGDGGRELNPFIGEHPSDTKLLSYIVITQLGVTILAHYMPRYRTLLLGGSAAVHGGCAIYNSGVK